MPDNGEDSISNPGSPPKKVHIQEDEEDAQMNQIQ